MMKKILVIGVTGYIGGRLVPRLLERDYEVRCMARDVSRAEGRWEGAEVVHGDVMDKDSLKKAMEEIDAAYYLIHSMSAGEKDFVDKDIRAADNFASAAREAGVQRIVYLGGLGSSEDTLSPHLEPRQKTGDELRKGSVPVTEFRAGMIVGSGSISFEMVRYLTERVPVMICPSWVRTRTQPIAVRDVLRYLIDTLHIDETKNRILEIGGQDILTYEQLMRIYGKVRGLKRVMIHVPFLTPKLSSYWVDFVTPIPSSIARPLIEGLRNELIVRDNTARDLFNFEPITYEETVLLALEREKTGKVETIWSGSLSSIKGTEVVPLDLSQKEGMIIEKRERKVNAPANKVFETICSIGGQNGWYNNFLWQLRGIIDRLVSGVGMRRGRRDPQKLRTGDPLDFWRVEAIEENKLLRLRAEMKLPGEALLQFSIRDEGNSHCILTQTAFFEPKGLFGLLYWYSIYPLHGWIFGGG